MSILMGRLDDRVAHSSVMIRWPILGWMTRLNILDDRVAYSRMDNLTIILDSSMKFLIQDKNS